MINEAIRLNYENGIQTGFSPFYLKMLSRCASAKGDEKIVERYTTLLHHHPFYGDWKAAPSSEAYPGLHFLRLLFSIADTVASSA